MVVSAPTEKKHELVLKRINNDHFQGRTNRHFRAILAIIWDEMALQVCLHRPRCAIKVTQGPGGSFSCVLSEIHVFSCSKGQLCIFFRGRTYHFSTVFGEYSGLNSSSRISAHRNGVQYGSHK